MSLWSCRFHVDERDGDPAARRRCLNDGPARQTLANIEQACVSIDESMALPVHCDKLTCGRTRHDHPMLVHCWASGCAAVPTVNQHWLNVYLLDGHRDRAVSPHTVHDDLFTVDQGDTSTQHNARWPHRLTHVHGTARTDKNHLTYSNDLTTWLIVLLNKGSWLIA